jgi:putative ABC transport system substrate-binding protein
MLDVRRREFIALLGGAVAAWPVVARGQQPNRMRRIGMLMGQAANDPEGQTRIIAFVQGLQQLGWTFGQNVRIDTRWGAGNADDIRKYAEELAGLAPDIILADGASTVGPLLQATRSVPVVFMTVVDPVGAGFVTSLARPGGNATGFTNFEYGLSGKWLELLKQMAPGVTRAAVLRDPAISAGIGQFAAIQSMAPSLGVEVIAVNVRDAADIERDVTAFARSPNGGLIVTGSALTVVHRDLIIALAAQHRLPTVYFQRFLVMGGGLISYGPDIIDQYRRAAGYVLGRSQRGRSNRCRSSAFFSFFRASPAEPSRSRCAPICRRLVTSKAVTSPSMSAMPTAKPTACRRLRQNSLRSGRP